MIKGVIIKALGGFYYVEHAGGTAECRARGRLRLENSAPLVGDRVEFIPTEEGRGYLASVFPRINSFVRPPVANIEKMVIVASASNPSTDPFLVDRMTAVAEKNGCESIICINKCDIGPAEDLFGIYKTAGFIAIKTSAETGTGLTELAEAIQGSICAFTGNSGVGKSSILNVLEPGLGIPVGGVGTKQGRGKHTTRHVELYKLSCGAIAADTPGFSAYDTDRLTKKEELAGLFQDFIPYLGKCRFFDCAHVKEPDCAVLEAVAAGELQKTRHMSYVRLYGQASGFKEWEHK